MRYEKSPDPSAVSIPVSERLQNILDNQTFARVSNKFSATKWGSHIALDLRKLSRGERPLYSTKETPYVLTFLKEFTENPLKYGQLTESVGLPKQNDVFIVKTPLSALYSILESGHKTAESLVRSVKEEFGETFTEAQLWEAKNRRWEYFEGLRHPA